MTRVIDRGHYTKDHLPAELSIDDGRTSTGPVLELGIKQAFSVRNTVCMDVVHPPHAGSRMTTGISRVVFAWYWA